MRRSILIIDEWSAIEINRLKEELALHGVSSVDVLNAAAGELLDKWTLRAFGLDAAKPALTLKKAPQGPWFRQYEKKRRN